MYFQTRLLEDTKAFAGTSGLDTIELPNKGLLSGIDLTVWGTCGAGGDKPDVWLHDRMTKIELVVNGSQVVMSLSGEQILALMLYKGMELFSHDMKNMVSASCEEFFHIPLGRYYHDLEYMLDLGRVNDPEIRIEYDFTKTSANGWTNGVAMSTAPSRKVIPHILRDADVVPRGYIKTSEVGRFTSGVSKKENVNLPRGPVYGQIYLQSWYAAQGIGYLLDKLELNINSDAIIPCRVGPNELAAITARRYGLFTIMQQFSAKGGQAYPTPIEQGRRLNAGIGLTDAIESAVDVWGNSSPLSFRKSSDGVTPVTGNVNINVTHIGVWPFSVSPIPTVDLMDERTWINSAELGDLWVRVEENASGGTSAVIKVLADEVVTSYLPV
jgi:hypothetical protein